MTDMRPWLLRRLAQELHDILSHQGTTAACQLDADQMAAEVWARCYRRSLAEAYDLGRAVADMDAHGYAGPYDIATLEKSSADHWPPEDGRNPYGEVR